MSGPQFHGRSVFVGPEDHHTTSVEAAARWERDHSIAWVDEPGPEDVWSSQAERDLEERDLLRTPRAGL